VTWYGNAWDVRPERVDAVPAGNGDVEHWHHGSPEIDERFGGWLACRRVNQLDVGGQRHGDAHGPNSEESQTRGYRR
jgi:hypothetical protein